MSSSWPISATRRAPSGGAQRLPPAAKVTTAAGAVEVKAPRVNDRRVDADTGERKRFSSAILPALVPQVPEDQRGAAAALPARPVAGRLRARAGAVPRLGAGLSPATMTRLTAQWQDDHAAFRDRDLSGTRLRVRLGGRHPPQGPPGGGEAVRAGPDRRARGRHARS